MKLEYFDLISPRPLPILNVGAVKPPALRDILKITRHVYETYLSFLDMTPMRYCTEVDVTKKTWFEHLDDEQICSLSMYDIAVSSEDLIQMYSHIFTFFFMGSVTYSKEKDAFLVFTQENVPGGGTPPALPGMIHKGNFAEIADLILQMNHIRSKNSVDLTRIKNAKGRARYLRMQKAKADTAKTPTDTKDIELGNIISVVCTRHKSINYLNVWDLTIYQIWDIFSRLQAENAYELGKTSVAVWGNKENRFDMNSWFHNLIT